MYSFSTDELKKEEIEDDDEHDSRSYFHGTVVAAVEDEVEEEDSEEVVGGSWSSGDAEVEAENNIDGSNNKQAHKSGSGLECKLIHQNKSSAQQQKASDEYCCKT